MRNEPEVTQPAKKILHRLRDHKNIIPTRIQNQAPLDFSQSWFVVITIFTHARIRKSQQEFT